MKRAKKLLSIILAIALLLPPASIAMFANAATEAQLNALVAALTNDNVANANYVFTNTTGNTPVYTCTVADPTGDVQIAAAAYWAAFTGTYTRNGNRTSNNTTRTSTQTNNTIKEQVQDKMTAQDFSDYNVGTVLSAFDANALVPGGSNSTTNFPATRIDVVVQVQGDDSQLLQYATVADVPNTLVFSSTYSVRNTRAGNGNNRYYRIESQTNATPSVSSTTFNKAPLTAFETALNNNIDLFDATLTLEDFIALGTDQLAASKNALQTAYNNARNAVSTDVYNHFFGAYAVQAVLDNLTLAHTIATYLPIAEEITTLCATDFSEFGLTELETLYNTLNTKYTAYKASAADARAYIEAQGIITPADVEAKLAELLTAYELAELRAFKSTTDAALEAYSGYDEDDVLDGVLSGAQLTLIKGELSGYVTALGSYNSANVLAVFGDGYIAQLQTLINQIAYLQEVYEFDTTFAAAYAYFTSTVYSAVNIDDDSADLRAAVESYDGWYADLLALVEEIRTELSDEFADKILTTLFDEMQTNLDSRYNVLQTRMAAQVETAYELYEKIQTLYGAEVTIVSLDTFHTLKNALGFIEKDIYEFLDASEAFTIDEVVKEKYEALFAFAFDAYDAFVAAGGFNNYSTTTVDDILRLVSLADIARDSDYLVTDEKLDGVITALDALLSSSDFAALTGLDLSAKLGGLLDGIYTNDLINTIVQYVYPVVADEFLTLWADLPDSVEAEASGQVVEIFLSIDAIEKATQTLGLSLFPSTLADLVEDEYPAVAALMEQANTPATIDYNPWEAEVLCDEEGKLILDWGVTDRASFIKAASYALKGLEPLFLALLANQEFATGDRKIGTGAGSTEVACVTVNVTVDPVTVAITAAPNAGYNNALVPIFDALGVTTYDGNTFTSIDDIVRLGLLEPIETLLRQLSASPLDLITKILPNIAYALSAGLVEPLLGMLKTNLVYIANAEYTTDCSLAGGGRQEDVLDSADTPIEVNLQEMLDLESLGLDLSSFDAVFSLLTGLLGIDLPKMDAAAVATMGELVWKDSLRSQKTYDYNNGIEGEEGKVAFIEANQADVLLFVLDYLFEAIATDESFLPTLIAAFGEGDDAVEISPLLLEIINNAARNDKDAIAAIVELVYPQGYTQPGGMVWREPIDTGGTPGIDEDGNPFITEDIVTYSDAWTKDKADYVANNLPTFLDNILLITGASSNGVPMENLSGAIDALTSGLFTAQTLNDLAATLSDFFADAGLPALLFDLLKTQIGLDIEHWANYAADFPDGDDAAFLAALIDLLKPFESLLRFILAGEDIVLNFGGTDVVTLKGFTGYANGLIPLLETLGATNVLTTDAFIADKENILSNVLNPILSVLAQLEENPYDKIIQLLPNILYYLASDGLTVAVDNLLYPVLVVLDTIRPIYDINIFELIDFDIRFAQTDPVSFLFTYVSSLIYEATGLDFKFNFTAESMFDLLGFGDREEYISANGETAYRIVNSQASAADMLTVVLRYLLEQFVFSENIVKFATLARDQFDLNDETYAFLYALLYTFRYLHDTEHTDYALGVLYWVFYGADTAAGAIADYYDAMRYDWDEIIRVMNDSEIPYIQKAGYLMTEFYRVSFPVIFDKLMEAVDVPIRTDDINVFVRLFREFIALIQSIIERLKSMFPS